MAVSIDDGQLKWTAGIDLTEFRKQISEIQNAVSSIGKNAEKEARKMDELAKKAAYAFGAYISATAATGLIKQIVKVRGEFQQLEVAFETMLQSKEKADKLLADVTKFAATTPFGLQEVAGTTKQLLAFGIQAEDVEKTLRSLGDVAAGLGQPLGEIAYLYGTIKTQGVALTQDVRQFASRGIPIYEELAKVLGVAQEKVAGFITAGKVGFPEIQKVFQNLTAEGSKFGGLMEAQSKTLTGMISNLEDAFDQMLNQIGRSGEGLFAGAIGAVTTLVENYQTVLKVLGVLIATYGAYRAALIATTIVQQVQAQMALQQALAGTKLNTVQALQAVLVRNVQGAWKSLNAVMKLSPIGLAVGLIGGLVTALLLWRDTSTATEKAQKALNEANEEFNKQIDETKQKTTELVSIINNENSSRFAQVRAFDELRKLYPEALKNMTLLKFQALEAGKAQKIFNESIDTVVIQKTADDLKLAREEIAKYVDMLNKYKFAAGARSGIEEKLAIAQERAKLLEDQFRKNEQALYEANTPIDQQIKDLEKSKGKLIEFRTQLEGNIQKMEAMGVGALDFRQIMHSITLSNLNNQLDELVKKIGLLRDSQKPVTQDKEYWEKLKKNAEDAVAAIDVNDKDFYKKKGEQVKIIREAEIQIKKYDTALKNSNKLENERNAILERRRKALQDINDLVRAAQQTSMLDEAREIDQINEKYEEQIRNLRERNEEIAKYNRRHASTQIPLIAEAEFDRVLSARNLELANRQYKKDSDLYIEGIKEKEAAFDELMRIQQSGNELLAARAKEIYKSETKDYGNYIDFLNAELERLQFINYAQNDGDIGTLRSEEEIKKKIAERKKKEAEIEKQIQIENYKQLLDALNSFNQRRLEINNRYTKLETELVRNQGMFTPEDFAARRKALENARADEQKDLERDLVRQSAIYKKMAEDLLLLTKNDLKERVKDIRKTLQDGFLIDAEGARKDLTPEMRKQLEEFLKMLQEYVGQLNEAFGLTAKQWAEIADKSSQISGLFDGLASSVEGLNEGLADTLRTMGELVSVAGSVSSAISSFTSGNILGGIGGIVGAIGGIFSLGSKARESRRKAEAEMAAFQLKQMQGELEIDALYRERELSIARQNKLRIEGIEAEKELLLEQKKLVEEQYNDILKQLQEQSYIVGQTTEKYGGFLGAARKTRVVNIQQTIGNQSFQDLETLNAQGRLIGKAKELFDMLVKIKEEGENIDDLLAKNQQEAAELFTGTTTDSISSAIIEGFKAGKRGAADFADDFQGLMQQALLQALQFRYLEGPLNDFFTQFADATQSGDQLDAGEIDRLQQMYNAIIENASTQFQQLQDIANLNFTGSGSGSNSLTGAIKGMTEQQAELLAGQFGGLRITAIDQLRVAESSLRVQQGIESNTAWIIPMYKLWQRLEVNGLKAL